MHGFIFVFPVLFWGSKYLLLGLYHTVLITIAL